MFKYLLILSLLFLSIKSNLYGIDISYHNGEIDFSKIKSKVDFVIMRAGYGNKTIDSKEVKFDIYYEEAKKNNIPVGTYWYCYAYTPEEALVEAKTFLNKVKGKKFEFPVYYDVEESKILDTGSDNVNALINTFCGELEKNNYYCGLYSSSNYLKNLISEEVKQKYAIWVAHWNVEKPSYQGPWGIWQYTSDGNMDGVESKRLDLDVAVINYEPIIKFLGKNGYDKFSK
jgi:GH25 family lysozyme M1 (1,4-beta-N-acetylmuramidase)